MIKKIQLLLLPSNSVYIVYVTLAAVLDQNSCAKLFKMLLLTARFNSIYCDLHENLNKLETDRESKKLHWIPDLLCSCREQTLTPAYFRICCVAVSIVCT